MNSSYKIALISAAVLCVVVMAFYMSDGEPTDATPPISAPSDDTADTASSTPPGSSPAAATPTPPPTRPSSRTPATSDSTNRATGVTSTPRPGDSTSSSSNDLAARVRAMQQSTNRPTPSSSQSDSDLFGSLSPTSSRPPVTTPTPIDRDLTPPMPTPGSTPSAPAASDNVITLGEEPTPSTARSTPELPPVTPRPTETGLSRPLPTLPGSSSPAPTTPDSRVTPPTFPRESTPAVTPRPTTPPSPPVSSPATYTIQEGDTLSSIAADLSRRYNARLTWIDVAQANPTMDPNRLKVGQVIKLPPRPTASSRSDTPSTARPRTADATDTRYTVRAGETLSAIARQHYGDESKWHIIYEANRPTIGNDPDRLREGMKLVIPPAPNPAR